MAEDKRSSPRLKAYAKVVIKARQTLGYMRDLSREGCHLALTKPIALERGETLAVDVLPGSEIGIPDFSLSLLVLWAREDPVFFNVGGRITPLPGGENEQNLARLLGYYQ